MCIYMYHISQRLHKHSIIYIYIYIYTNYIARGLQPVRNPLPVRNPNSSYTVPKAGAVPDMPSIHNILRNFGQCFGRRSGLDRSSRRKATTVLHGIAVNVYLIFSHMSTNHQYLQIYTNTIITTGTSFYQTKQNLRQA